MIAPKERKTRRTLGIACSAISIFMAGALGMFILFIRGCMSEHSRMIGHNDLSFDLSKDGKSMVFSAEGLGGRDLFLLNLKSKAVTRLTETPDYEICPSFSPDNKTIAFTIGHPGIRADQLCVMDLTTRSVRQLTDADENISGPVFSASGERIIYTLADQYRWGGLASSWSEAGELYTIKLDGTDRKHIKVGRGKVAGPQVSRDGKWLAFSMYVAPADSPVNNRQLYDGATDISFSPESKQAVFCAGEYSPDFKIYTVDLEGGEPRMLARGWRDKDSSQSENVNTRSIRGGCFHPRVSADGKSVFFLVEEWRGGQVGTPVRSLWTVPIGGGEAKEFASSTLFEAPMMFSP